MEILMSLDLVHASFERTSQFDWLSADAQPAAIAPLLAAFANTSHGGKLLLGVEGDGTVSGVKDVMEAVDRALQAALMIVPTLVIPLPRVLMIDEKPVIEVEIPAGMPHVYALEGRYLTREEGKSVPMHPRELRRLLIQRGEISFETEIAHGAALSDLDWDKVRAYGAKVGITGDVEQFLLKRGCLVETSEGLCPTNAGFLLFGLDVQSRLRGAEITAVRFAGETMSDTFNRQDITGRLPDQIRRAETFLRDHLRKGVALQDTMERSERFEYPLEAARELVVNAVAHRDYSIQGDGIRLYLFKDHMEISSPGLLPGPVTIDNIADERFSRNPAIVQVLADMGFIERLGYGIDRVLELMKQNKLKSPDFKETGGGLKVILYNNAAVEAPIETQPVELPSVSTDPPVLPPTPITPASILGLTPETIEAHLSDYREIPINPRQETALVYVKLPGNTRITNSELQKLYPDVHAETIRRDLSDLVTKNLLVKMGEKRGSYYVLKREDES
jgi:ATP-dependent DNA helicase RecG